MNHREQAVWSYDPVLPNSLIHLLDTGGREEEEEEEEEDQDEFDIYDFSEW